MDVLLVTDMSLPGGLPSNLHTRKMRFSDVRKLAENKLGGGG